MCVYIYIYIQYLLFCSRCLSIIVASLLCVTVFTYSNLLSVKCVSYGCFVYGFLLSFGVQGCGV